MTFYPDFDVLADLAPERRPHTPDQQLLVHAAATMHDEAAKVRGHLSAYRQPGKSPTAYYQDRQSSGLGGPIGDFGALMHPAIAEGLARLLAAVADDDMSRARRRARDIAEMFQDAVRRRDSEGTV